MSQHAEVRALAPSRQVTIEVPASSANLGPGFDSLGIALDLVDRIHVELTDAPAVLVEVDGDAQGVAMDESNLVVRTVRAGLAAFVESRELAARGVRVRCRNAIPHSRGLGSSAAAIVAGLAAAAHLAGVADDVSPAQLVALATRLEGHPDNVAASVLGGATIAWMAEGSAGPAGMATRFEVHAEVTPVLVVPGSKASTAQARGALPPTVGHGDASFNAGRAALLVHALSVDPDLLLPATEDRLHQRQRSSVYPESFALVQQLRKLRIPAAISGAGPSVIAFAVGAPAPLAARIADVVGDPDSVHVLGVAATGVRAV